MFTPPTLAGVDLHIHDQKSDALARCLVEYRHAFVLLSTRIPAGAEPLRDYIEAVIHLMEEELQSRGETDE